METHIMTWKAFFRTELTDVEGEQQTDSHLYQIDLTVVNIVEV